MSYFLSVPDHEQASRMTSSAAPLVVGFDTETTGLDTSRDEALSYGFAVFRNGVFQERESSHFFVKTTVPSHPKAEEIHGITRAALEAGAVPGDVHESEAGTARAVHTLLDLYRAGAIFIGANPRYDVDMLTATLARHSDRTLRRYRATITKLPFHDVIQTHALQHQTRRRSLTTLCEIHGVTPGNHDALGDARASVEVYFKQQDHPTRSGYVSFASPGVRAKLRETWAVLTRSAE